MRRYPRFTVALSLMLALAALLAMRAFTPGVAASHTCELRVWVNGQPTGPKFAVNPDQYPELCGAHTPTPAATATRTATTTATMTMTMPMPTATGTPPAAGWHAPTDHEHGDPPPAWVLTSGHAPFTQTRESHVGYKGVYAVSAGGAESYLITHVLSTVAARSHGDHDYQYWLRDPESSEIVYSEGQLDFGSPPPLRTSDTGERPIILSQGDGGCETWYSAKTANMNVGWVICGRYQNFAGDILGGTGTGRTMDWMFQCDGLQPTSALRNRCVTEFGVSRISFLVSSKDYFVPGIVPIN